MPIAPYKGAKRKTVEYAKIIILGKVFLNLSHMSGGVTSLGEGGGGGQYWNHPFSTYAKFSEKLIFLAP